MYYFLQEKFFSFLRCCVLELVKVLLLKCIIYKFNDHDVLSAFDGLLPTEKEPERAFQSFSNYWQVTFRAERHSGVCFLIQTKTILKGIYFLYWLISLGYD